ncbi:acylphosphatase [Ancylobacter sp. A5.8]|uniref:acylphosphatase n=1 Tax=Ancylobacter gelatini TaxID=2919920 RepID=UPI001F4E40D0|nr:acylphosphatase [Ancylobacter gelatini]MCJ8141474.1 acylphosphatase [Ancylobacter gelatini]
MTVEKAVHLLVHGRVQGVGYRAWLASEARRRSLRGWVRNRRDGTVEAEIEGEAGAVAQMIAACRQGPPAASVSAIDTAEIPATRATGFEVRPTT